MRSLFGGHLVCERNPVHPVKKVLSGEAVASSGLDRDRTNYERPALRAVSARRGGRLASVCGSVRNSLICRMALHKSLICRIDLLQVVDFHDSFRYFQVLHHLEGNGFSLKALYGNPAGARPGPKAVAARRLHEKETLLLDCFPGGNVSRAGRPKKLENKASRFPVGNPDPQSTVQQAPILAVRVLEIEHFHFGLAPVQGLAQEANELEILLEEGRLDEPEHRRDKPGVPVQSLPKNPHLVLFRRAFKSSAEQRLEGQTCDGGIINAARSASTKNRLVVP